MIGIGVFYTVGISSSAVRRKFKITQLDICNQSAFQVLQFDQTNGQNGGTVQAGFLVQPLQS